MRDHSMKLAVAAAIVMTLAFTFFASPGASYAQDKNIIGVINHLSGMGAELGQAGRMGSTIVSEEINAAGGVGGKKIDLVYRDDESNPQKAVSAANELIFKQGVKVIMGTNLTHVANAINKIINNEKVIFVTIGTGNALINPSEFPYTFRLNVPTDKEAEVLVKYMIEKVPGAKLGILRDSTALGQTGLNSVLAALKPRNVTPVDVEQYNPGDTDMTAQLLKLKNAGAEKIIAWGSGPDLIQVSNGFSRIKWYPPIGSGIGLHHPSFKQFAAKDVARNWFGTMQKAFTYPSGGTVSPEVQKFIAKIKEKFGAEAEKNYIPNAGIWYDMIKLYAKAAEGVKSQDSTQIKGFIEAQAKFDGLVAQYSFGPANHDGFPLSDLAVAWGTKGDAFSKERVE